MVSSVRRWLGVALLLATVVAASLQARGLALLLTAFTWSGAPTTLPREASATPTKHEAKPTQPLGDPAGAQAKAPSRNAAPLDPLSWPDCRDVRVTIVTQYSDPWFSRATLREAGTEGARFSRVGDTVAGKKLAFIGQNPRSQLPSVWLEDGERGCQAALFAEPAVLTKASATASDTTPATSGLRRLGNTEVEADRQLRERILENPMDALRRVRFVPEQQNGRVVGIRLFGIPRGSLLDAIGLKNGDRLDSINGFNLANPEQALLAYARLRSASELKVTGRRAGQPLEIQVHIH